MKIRALLLALLAAPAVWPAGISLPGIEPGEAMSGGETTVFDATDEAFRHGLANLGRPRMEPMREGQALFEKDWTADKRNIAGPLLNEISCASCHFRGGRAQPHPEPGAEAPLLLRLSVAGAPDPVYGWQLNDRAIAGVPAEGKIEVKYAAVPGRYPNGAAYTLRRPRYRPSGLAYGALDRRIEISPRVPLPVFGLGLLEAVPDAAILALADPDDADGDGISGRPNQVWSARAGRVVLGRFGWKASQPTLEQQIASAYSEDLGLTSALYPEPNCTPRQKECRAAAARTGTTGTSPELSEHQLARTALHVRLLAVPGRRDWADPAVLRGKALFARTGCAACHYPTFQTREAADVPELAGQTLHPYTDLLLHDLGEGLADGRPDSAATGREWRTPPLWGLGLLETVGGQVRLLHDGRARSPEEAILWHGGEAEASRERFRKLEPGDRAALLRFLRSL
jgi:CxxC motif-containing protein (DUF1111 family)